MSNMLSNCKKLFNPRLRFGFFSSLGLYNWMGDERYLKKEYYSVFGKKLNLDNPETFNEKLQWLKLHDRKDVYTDMADKAEAKKIVARMIGEQHIIPTLCVCDRFEEIDFNSLPNQFVIKCTHDSGGLVICKDKATLDIEQARNKINKFLKRKYFYLHREWPYKNIKPRIIIEKYMEDSKTKDLRDYKFFIFNGRVECFKVDFDRFTRHRANYYDRNQNILKFGEQDYPPNYKKRIKMPGKIQEMIQFAEKIAGDIPFLRVDFYSIDNKVLFGEITFFPAAGLGKFVPEVWDDKLGKLLNLDTVKK